PTENVKDDAVNDDADRLPVRRSSTPTPPRFTTPERDYSEFCAEYKQRFLYVCPDPFRFGQRAAVFCPIYSERCHVTVPDRPVVPTEKPPVSPARRICSQYRAFAITYCNNPFALQQPNVREGCEKYRRFCTTPARRQG
ncbi:Protein T01D1.3, partial [Aphelenchoides avenae]